MFPDMIFVLRDRDIPGTSRGGRRVQAAGHQGAALEMIRVGWGEVRGLDSVLPELEALPLANSPGR